jgi:hypothetical protein
MKMGTRQYLFCGWRYSVDYMAAYGLPFHIEKGAGSTDVWKETHAAWTPLLKLIEPVRAALQKKRDLYYLERDIKWQTRRYYRAKYQADKYKRYFDVEKERLEKERDHYRSALQAIESSNSGENADDLERRLHEIEEALWEFEANVGDKPNYTEEGFRGGIKIFMSVMVFTFIILYPLAPISYTGIKFFDSGL